MVNPDFRLLDEKYIQQEVTAPASVKALDHYDGASLKPNANLVSLDMLPVKEAIKNVTSGLFSKFKNQREVLTKLAASSENLSPEQLAALKKDLEDERKRSPRLFKLFKPNKAILLSALENISKGNFEDLFKDSDKYSTLDKEKIDLSFSKFATDLIKGNIVDVSKIKDDVFRLNEDVFKAALPKMPQETKNKFLFKVIESTLSIYFPCWSHEPVELLLRTGADATEVPDNILLEYPKVLAAALPKMPQERKNALLATFANKHLVVFSDESSRKTLSELVKSGADLKVLSKWIEWKVQGTTVAMLIQSIALFYEDSNLLESFIETANLTRTELDELRDYCNKKPGMLKILQEFHEKQYNKKLKELGVEDRYQFNRSEDPTGELLGLGEAKLKLSSNEMPGNIEQSDFLDNMAKGLREQLLREAIDANDILLAKQIIANRANDLGKILLINPVLLEVALPELSKQKKEELLTASPPADITRALLVKALADPMAPRVEAPPEKPEIDPSILNSKGLFDVSSPNAENRNTSVGEDFFQPLRVKSLSDLLDDYENFKIGRGLPENLAPQNLAAVLSVVRAIISSKMTKLSGTEKTELKSKIARFKTTAAATQFSGALQSAHRRGITGEGVEVAVWENIAEDVKTIGTAQVTGNPFVKDSSHGYNVTGLVQQLAPNSSIKVQFPGSDVNQQTKIVNCSFGSPVLEQTSPLLKAAMESGKLVVKSAGNKGKTLDYAETDIKRYNDQNFLTHLPDDQKGRMILTGNLQAGNVPAPSSNMPGTNEKLQDHFLWTLGSDVLTLTGPDKVGRETGTSMSAPIVTGAAALVQSFWPEATPEQVKECLLESADRDFWIHKPDISIHVVAPDKLSELKVDSERAEATWPFDKRVFGKGLLNVRRALEYANLKKTHPELRPDQICRILELREEQAATKIQALFRGARVRADKNINREDSTSSLGSSNSSLGDSSGSNGRNPKK